MSKLRLRIARSLDGYVAVPRQSVENPLGVGGMRLHEWVFPLAAWRAMQGLEGGEVDASTPVVEESLANLGATVMGRNMFGGHPGPCSACRINDRSSSLPCEFANLRPIRGSACLHLRSIFIRRFG